MTVGYNAQLTKGTIDAQLGSISQRLNIVLEDVNDFKYFIDGILDAQLTGMGYDANDVALIRTAASDMDQLREIYQGLAALAAVKDFRTFIRRVWGTGYSGVGV